MKIVLPIILLCLLSCQQPAERKTVITTPLFDSILFNNGSHEKLERTQVLCSYTNAIGQYISAMQSKGNFDADTLYIPEQPEFPDIVLPEQVNKIPIVKVPADKADMNTLIASHWTVNVAGWLTGNKTEFILVTFHDGGKPQHNCHLFFTNDFVKNAYKLDTLYFEYAYGK